MLSAQWSKRTENVRCFLWFAWLRRQTDAPCGVGVSSINCSKGPLLSLMQICVYLLTSLPQDPPHKDGVGTLLPDLSLSNPGCFIGSCKAHPGLLRMVSFSKEHDRNVFSCPFYSVKWGPQNLVITAPARIGFTAFNRVCSIGHPVIYDTARVITKGSNQTKSDQSGPTPFLCGTRAGSAWLRANKRRLTGFAPKRVGHIEDGRAE